MTTLTESNTLLFWVCIPSDFAPYARSILVPQTFSQTPLGAIPRRLARGGVMTSRNEPASGFDGKSAAAPTADLAAMR